MSATEERVAADDAGGGVARWGSDLIADQLRSFGIPFMALTPGSSYRGLHDSVVNHLGNCRPELVLCLQEQQAVAVAHGYAKVSGRPLAVGLHANVGLMNAVMAIYNAFCDRVPMLIIGANGPLDAAERRPWIDWLHSSADPGGLVRSITKWDDQPVSVRASLESLVRGLQLTSASPSAPVYVCLDVSVQERPVESGITTLDPRRYAPPAAPVADPVTLDAVERAVREAASPLLLVGRVSRSRESWAQRIALAEALSARVGTDLKVGSSFPTEHPLHVGAPGLFAGRDLLDAIRAADVVLALDWIDLGGTLRAAYGERPVAAHVISCVADSALHNGWSKDHFELAPVDVPVDVHPDALVSALSARLTPGEVSAGPRKAEANDFEVSDEPITIAGVAVALRRVVGDRRVCLARVPLGWASSVWPFDDPLDCLGADGGGGLGSGPGIAVGAALALREDDRLVVAVLGDGDTLMGASAFWTAARLRLPMLVVVANNSSFMNDEIHQQRVAARRGRPVENAHVGVRLDDPQPDLVAHVGGLGVSTFGPVTAAEQLIPVLTDAVRAATTGPALVDVHVARAAYTMGE